MLTIAPIVSKVLVDHSHICMYNKDMSIVAETQPVLDELRIVYEHPSRAYHNLDHIHNMLKKLTESEKLAEHPHRIILAIWFHNAIYNPARTDNEVKSAEFWIRKMTPYLLEEPLKWGKMAILATINHFPNPDPDIQLLLDLDLASLGASWEVFQENSEQIRQEYIHVSNDDFRKGRKVFLEKMLKRPRLFGTEHWHNLLEKQARNNMEKTLEEFTTIFP